MYNEDFKYSPFFVEDTGNKSNKITIAYHPTKEFKKTLLDFKKIRCADLTNSDYIDRIVKSYYFKYAHERKSYGKTIVALIHKKELASDKPAFIPLFVRNRYPKDKYDTLIDEEIIAYYGSMEYIAPIRKFADADNDTKTRIVKTIVSDGFAIDEYDVFKKLKNFDEDSLKDFFVLEIPLNNYLDTNIGGVYCYHDIISGAGLESMHVGLAMSNSNVKDNDAIPIPIIYSWKLKEDFTVEVYTITKISLRDLERQCQKYNVELFVHLKLFEATNISDDFKLREIKQRKRELQKEMDRLDEQEQLLLNSDAKND